MSDLEVTGNDRSNITMGMELNQTYSLIQAKTQQLSLYSSRLQGELLKPMEMKEVPVNITLKAKA